MAKVAVVILNYNGEKFLKKFLPIVIEKSADDAEIWVADNDSSDHSVELLKNDFPSVKLILLDKNYGFAGGYNQALKKIKADYYVLLNSDIEVTENWIKPVIQLMETDHTIGACQPKLLSYFEKHKFEYAGAAGGFIDKYGYPFCRGRLFMNLEEDHGQYDNVKEVFWATGACMFVRSDVYHRYGGLDDEFFAHMEEIDFCWRLKNNGYKIMHTPESTVYHVGGGTLPKSSARKTYLNFRNNFFLLYKNLPDNRLWKVIITRLFLDGVAGLKFLSEGHFGDTVAVIKAHFSFYRSLNKLNKKRKALKQIPVSQMYMGNIVIEHYVKGKKTYTQLDQKKFS